MFIDAAGRETISLALSYISEVKGGITPRPAAFLRNAKGDLPCCYATRRVMDKI